MNLQGMPVIRASRMELKAYNRLVLQTQDEAFCLAYDLLGVESAADTVVQGVFLDNINQPHDSRMPFRLRVLQGVVRACLKRGDVLQGPERIEQRLARLSNEEKVALLLVERMGFNYLEASAVLGKNIAEFRGIVAKARFSISQPL
jgi:DNA-directed RNA polymerase specialized sigma24 family protein